MGGKQEFVLTEQYVVMQDEEYLASVQARRARGGGVEGDGEEAYGFGRLPRGGGR